MTRPTISLRTPAGNPQFRARAGEFTLVRTRDRNWRVTRDRNGGWFDLATRRTLLVTLWTAWRRRHITDPMDLMGAR